MTRVSHPIIGTDGAPATVVPVAHAESARIRPVRWFLGGALVGFAVGVVARAWMRWISADPEFSWSGTIFILVAFTLLGAVQAGTAAARRSGRSRRRTTVYRLIAAVLSLPLFAGAGAIMLPGVAFGGLAVWRRDWHPVRRVIAAMLGSSSFVLMSVLVIDDSGLGLVTPVQLAVVVATYAVVIAAVGATIAPLDDGWRMSRTSRRALVVVIGLIVVLFVIGTVGLPLLDA